MTDTNSGGTAAWRVAGGVLAATAGLGAGAALMYLWDPERGRTRRHRLAEETSGLLRRNEITLEKRGKDLLNRVRGVAAEAAHALSREEPVSDEVLGERVRSRMGHVIPHPHEIQARAKDGVVTLEGKLSHAESRRLKDALRTVRGLKRIDDRLTTGFALTPGVLVGLAAGLALLGKTATSLRSHAQPAH
jgi:hypothetical protein